MTITTTQVRMAMAALGWTNEILAQKSSIGKATAARYLLKEQVGKDIILKIENTLLREGVLFVQEPIHKGYGVVIRQDGLVPEIKDISKCPFCGCSDQDKLNLTTKKNHAIDEQQYFFVECGMCGAQGPSDTHPERASRLWGVKVR